jgi:hypothetical protein
MCCRGTPQARNAVPRERRDSRAIEAARETNEEAISSPSVGNRAKVSIEHGPYLGSQPAQRLTARGLGAGATRWTSRSIVPLAPSTTQPRGIARISSKMYPCSTSLFGRDASATPVSGRDAQNNSLIPSGSRRMRHEFGDSNATDAAAPRSSSGTLAVGQSRQPETAVRRPTRSSRRGRRRRGLTSSNRHGSQRGKRAIEHRLRTGE